jgi:hypothetical protein
MQVIARVFGVSPQTLRIWMSGANIPTKQQETLQVYLEGLEFSECFWSRELRRLHAAFCLAEANDHARWRYANMIAMLLAQWASEYGFNFELVAHRRRNVPSVLRIWATHLPEVKLDLRVSPTRIMLHVITVTGLQSLHLEPCIVNKLFTELKLEERQNMESKKKELSSDVLDDKITEDYGAPKT